MDQLQSDIQSHIEERIRALDPAIELIAVERAAAERLRLFIDHPGGVDLNLCERVTGQLRELLSDYALEVSSPGLDRPLTKPEHYRRFLGRKVRIRTREAVEGRRSFTGRLAAADDEVVCVEHGDARIEIPLRRVRRSNLIPDPSEVRP